MSARRNRWLSAAGFLLGAAAAALIFFSGRVPAGSGRLGADVVLSVSAGAHLEAAPAGPFLHVSGLEAGEATTGRFEVRNGSGMPLAVRVRAQTRPRSLDGVLAVEVHTDRERLFRGVLGRLRAKTARRFLLAERDRQTLHFRIALPQRAARYRGRIVDARIVLDIEHKERLD